MEVQPYLYDDSMRFFKQTVAIVGGGLGLVFAPNVVRSEQAHREEHSWLSLLVRTASDSSVGSAQGSHFQEKLNSKPGRVLVWGGKFGRVPRPVPSIGDNIVQVAVADGLGAAVDDHGNVHGFVVTDQSEKVETIQMRGRAVDIAVREASREIVVLDSSGRVAVSRYTEQETFEPAKHLQGAINRAKLDKLRCGKDHCIAITKHGEAFSWGSNSHGQLGLGDVGDPGDRNPEIPRQMIVPDGVRVSDAACGSRHTILLDRSGALFGMGDDRWAQLGISAEPWLQSHKKASGVVRKSVLVGGLAGRAIAGGGQHSVMLVRDGTVFSFGFNQWGQLGHHNYSSLAPPSPTADYTIRAAAISAGDNHTCIVKDNGEMWCIGGNDQGQLGTGKLQPSMVWKRVRLGKKPLKPACIYLSGNTTAAILPVDKDRHSSAS